MSSVLASVSTRKEKAAKAMASLHSHRNLIISCITDWEELERSFGVTERALQQKFKEIAEKEKEYDGKMEEARAALEKREESIAGLEEASLARVKEQKDTALAAIAEERKKLEEEQIKWREEKKIATGGKGKEIGTGITAKDASADHSPLVFTQQKGEKQAPDTATPLRGSKEVGPKVTLSKDLSAGARNGKRKDVKETEAGKKVGQQLKVEDVKEAQKNEGQHDDNSKNKRKDVKETEAGKKIGQQLKVDNVKEVQKKEGQRDEVSRNKRKDAPFIDEAAAKRPKELTILDAKATGGTSNGARSLEDVIKMGQLASEGSVSVRMKIHVVKMDWEGLRDFVVSNRKEFPKLRAELQAALQASTDPCGLLLKVLEGSESVNRVVANNKTGQACIVLLESLSEVVADPVLGVDYPVVPSDSKERARCIARRWKSKIDPRNLDGLAVGSHLFLQLLASFGIGTDYGDEDLLTYVVYMSRRGLGHALCRSLGLTEKIPALIDRLANGGKQVEAIAFASSFNLLDKFNIVILLRSYLDGFHESAGSKRSDTLTKQITVLKNAVKVVEEHNLESQFPVEDLRMRMSVLLQGKAERKKARAKLTQKDRLVHEYGSGRPTDEAGVRAGLDSDQGKHGIHDNAYERDNYTSGGLGLPIRGEYINTDIGRPLLPPSYNADIHYRYERRPESAYDGYAMGNRSPVSRPSTFAYQSSGSVQNGLMSRLPTMNSYSGITRDELLQGRPSYPEGPGPSRNYELGSGLHPPSYPPYYLR